MSDTSQSVFSRQGYLFVFLGCLAVLVGVGVYGSGQPDGHKAVFMIQGWAFSAVLLSVVGAALRLYAHDDKTAKNMDGYGKLIALNAAILAVPAAALAAFVVKWQA